MTGTARFITVLPVWCGLMLAACASPAPDSVQIRAHLEAMAAALEAQNARQFMRYLADDFGSSTYDLDQNAARLLLRREMMARERIRVRLMDVQVEMRGADRAVATFQAVLTGGSGLLPSEGRWYRVESGWRRERGEWLMIAAEWEPVGPR